MEKGQQPPFPPARGLGSAVSSPAGFGQSPDRQKDFPVFSTLRMVSPDIIILLIIEDYHVAIGGVPRAPSPFAYAAHSLDVLGVFSDNIILAAN